MNDDLKQYKYKLSGKPDLVGALAENAGSIDGVKECEFDSEASVLTLGLDNNASEYDVFRMLSELAEKVDVDVDDYVEEPSDKESDEKEGENAAAEEESVPAPETKSKEAVSATPSPLKLPDEEQPWKKKHLGELIELGISAILLIFAFIFSANEETVAVALLAYIVVAYEIIWDAAVSLWKKNFYHYSIALVPPLIALLFLVDYKVAALIALLLQAQIVLSKILGDISSAKLKKRLRYDFVEVTPKGEEDAKFAKDVEVGTVVTFADGDLIPFDGKVVEGSGKADTFNWSCTHTSAELSEGSNVLGGCVLKEGEISLEVKRPVSEGFAANIYSDLTSGGKTTEFVKTVKKYIKLLLPVSLAVSLVICFLLPLLTLGKGGSYVEALPMWCSFGVLLFLLTNGFVFLSAVPIAWKNAMSRALELGAIVNSERKFEGIADADVAFFNEPGALTENKFSVNKIIAVPEYKGKLLELLSGFGISTEKLLDDETVIETKGGDTVVADSYSNLVDKGIAVKKAAIGGKVRYIVLNGEVIGAVSFAEKLKRDSRGAVRELADAGVKSVILAHGDKITLSEFNGIAEIYEDMSEEAKNNVIADEAERGVKCVYVGRRGCGSSAEAQILMSGTEQDVSDACGAVLQDGNIKSAAKLFKLSKRLKKSVRGGVIAAFVAKIVAVAVGAALIFTGHPLLWVPVLIETVVGVVVHIVSALNGNEVY